jgi:hypothetical protein
MLTQLMLPFLFFYNLYLLFYLEFSSIILLTIYLIRVVDYIIQTLIRHTDYIFVNICKLVE